MSIKTISFDIKLNYFNFFYLYKNDYSKSADQPESSGKSVNIAAVLAWNPGQALSWSPRHAKHQREILSWIPQLFSIFVSRIPRKAAKSLPVHCNESLTSSSTNSRLFRQHAQPRLDTSSLSSSQPIYHLLYHYHFKSHQDLKQLLFFLKTQ